MTPVKSEEKYGITFGGGGAHSSVGIGLAHYLAEHNIKLDVISGTSGGAITGILYATDLIDDFYKMVISHDDPQDFLAPTRNIFSILWSGGIFSSKPWADWLRARLTNTMVQDAPPVYIAACNVNTGNAEVRCSHDMDVPHLIAWLQASSAVPIAFPSVKFGDYNYIDGGIRENFPVETVLDRYQLKTHYVLRNQSTLPYKDGRLTWPTFFKWFVRVISMYQNEVSRTDIELGHIYDKVTKVVSTPKLATTSILDFDKTRMTIDFNNGRDMGKKIAEEIAQ
jgi:predicted acylesterase/phospholipase RssA